MLYRIIELFQAMLLSLTEKMQHPESLLEQTYKDLQSNLIQTRRAVDQALATEKQLEQQVQKCQSKGLNTVKLEAQLKLQKENTESLQSRLKGLEEDVQMAYTKMQVLIAKNKVAQDSFEVRLPSNGATIVFLLLLVF